ncbi:hypothetical protein BaRGS_00018720 [Batillaria attramentaria]|uniref:Chitin-binding type-2 domain-containing protein n=1 Tax=Batillaria attramentaria TaxID=370345 RepID=A0ABD0KRT9_9CAEN
MSSPHRPPTTLQLVVALLLVLPSEGQNSTPFQPVCRSMWEWIRDPNDCGRFWRCSWGRAIEMPRCPGGLILNTALHVCVRRRSVYDDCDAPGGISQSTSRPTTSPTPSVTTMRTSTMSTTTSVTDGSTLGFSIFEYCARNFTAILPYPQECQAYYNCSMVYDTVPSFFEQYLVECPYPKLFDSQRRVCDDFWKCLAGDVTCTPCGEVLPSCLGRADGQQAVSGTIWTQTFVTCRAQRTVSQGQCDPDLVLNVPQVFSPVLRRCVSVYDVPRENGGLQPVCTGKTSGSYPDDNGRPSLFYVCINGRYNGTYQCPTNTVFNTRTKLCQQGTVQVKKHTVSYNYHIIVITIINGYATTIDNHAILEHFVNGLASMQQKRKGVVPRWLLNYQDECPYPKLFHTSSLRCEEYWNVDCGTRNEPKNACEYRNYKCEGDSCPPCDVPEPMCSGREDGNYSVSDTDSEWSPFFVTCRNGLEIRYNGCDLDRNLNVPQMFSPVLRICVHLYDVPVANGGLQPECNGRIDAMYPEENGRLDLFYECTDNVYRGMYRCPDNNYFHRDSRQCRPTLTTTAQTTTPAFTGTTLGFSIVEFCSRDFTALIPHPQECQAYYNCSMVYDTVPSFFEQYLMECPYPKLFDSQRRVCDDFRNVDCGARREAVSACDYRTYRCPDVSCTPCDVVLPSCAGREDGQNPASDGPYWPFTYVTCSQGRTVGQGQCDLDRNLDVPQVFSPILRRCVHLYDVPGEHGGRQPDCRGRPNGRYPEDHGRPDLYYECANGQYWGTQRCSGNREFSPQSQRCRSARDSEKRSQYHGQPGPASARHSVLSERASEHYIYSLSWPLLTRAVTVLALCLSLPCCLAYSFYREQIPNGDRVPHPCKPNFIWRGVGHKAYAGGGERNVFGLDFNRNGHKWTRALCEADSDGDGLTNGQELGDPDCVWKAGDIPASSSNISHPGICDPWTSPTCMSKNSWVDCESAGEFECEHIHSPDVRNVTIRFPRTKVPAKETTYMCFNFELPDDQEYHLIATKPVIDNDNVMHHMGLTGCSDSASMRSEPSECTMGVEGCDKGTLSIWTLGMTGECFNPQAGFRIGKGATRKVSMQMHWTNPKLVDTLYDSSGIVLYYTAKLRPYNAAVMTIGQVSLDIPPGRDSVVYHGACTSGCTNHIMKGPIHITNALNHMHYLGIRQNVTLHRPGRQPYTVTDDNPFSYDTPVLYSFNDPLTVRPGDELTTYCTFQSRSLARTTTFGAGSYDEMCFALLTYYPAENLTMESCVQWKDVDFCDIGEVCEDYAALFNASNPRTAKMIEKVMDVCSPVKCRPECPAAIAEIRAENACLTGGYWRYYHEIVFLVSDVKLITFASAIAACDNDYHAYNNTTTVAPPPRTTPAWPETTAQPQRNQGDMMDAGGLFLNLIKQLDNRPLLQNIVMNVNYNYDSDDKDGGH